MKRSRKSSSRRRSAHNTVATRPLGDVASALVPAQPARGRGTLEADFSAVTRSQLATIRDTLQLSGNELGSLFGVTRQAVEQWQGKSVPVEQALRVDRVAEVVGELAKRFKPQRLPVVVRSPLPILDDRSILETLRTDGPPAIYEFFRRWSSYIPGVEPIRAGEFR